MANEVNINHSYQPQERFVGIKLIKGQKDSYGWEIKAEAKTVDEAVDLSEQADKKLREKFLIVVKGGET